MDDAGNPLVPTAGDFGLYALSLASVALLVWALVSLARFKDITALRRLAWCLVILFVPYVGCIAWLVLSRRSTDPGRRPPQRTR
jgi:cbb3-type cytochrome oxidase subunit 3